MLLEHLEHRAGRKQVALLPGDARAGVRVGEDAAEVRVAALRLAEQRDVRAVCDRHLGAGDRADAEVLRGMRELERAVDTVVVGERERVVAELGGARGDLLRQRRAVEERVRRMRMQLDVLGSWPGAERRSVPRQFWSAAERKATSVLADAATRGKRIARCEAHRARCPGRS